MEIRKLDSFVNGWFIGAFNPSLFSTESFEVAVKRYNAGDSEASHYHLIATEYTVIVEGEALFNDKLLVKDEIAVIYPGEHVRFEAVTDVVTVVVKVPSVSNDKYT
jgi:mannose-6-phosphate isomerase-like protein (cupin superfamily)